MFDHPERPEAVRGNRLPGGEWLVYLTIALLAGVVTALGVPWWLAVPVALALELACGIWMHR